MADMLEYLYWRGDLTLDCLPLNAVDGLILSWFASMPLREPVPETLGAAARELARRSDLSEDTSRYLRLLADSARFRDMGLERFEQRFSEEEEMQFAALTALPGDGTAFVSYRGTDGTLVGWKEDFNLSFSDEVPAQREAVRYLNEAGARGLPLRVGGHSKGGNLAVYAAARCAKEVQDAIEIVWNFDGPGLNAATIGSEGYRAVEPRIETYLPQSSIVGILLERTDRYRVVRSDGFGPLQHDPYTWQVAPDGFELLPSLSQESLYADRTIRAWLNAMTPKERETFVDALYDLVERTGATTVEEVGARWQESGWSILNAFGDLDLRTKAALFSGIGGLAASAIRNLRTP